ncbi:MAG: bifunctional hydroxymethylpyrimidine kinase/phosphomethylpyrimidine kinase [Thermodesulfobacteriota bacterium]|nr:bifunctional hydroxymethylpyrimidine kinase/phosphomethylpyrimidine kinase [Thermodesulfobacteriota bacterium]
MKRILTIAGSDSGGGAGIQADVKTITLLGGFATSVITALTAQNTVAVRAIHPVPPSFIDEQLQAVLSDIGADAAKTGMLFDVPAIEIVAHGLNAYGMENLVVDPVMVAKGGDLLLLEEAQKALIKHLIPMAFLVTPNIPEAEILSNRSIQGEKDMHEAARAIHALGPKHVLIKGGHLDGPAKDILYDGKDFFACQKDRVRTAHTHGTGCVYSAAIATHLAMGAEIKGAVTGAKDFVHSAIRAPLPLGKGHGPTNIYAPFLKGQARGHVIEALNASLARLQQTCLGSLMPEVQSNLGFALPFAETHADVAAFPGRLVRLEEKIMAVSSPCFGASRHIAAIILTAMRHDPAFRSAMNIRFSEARVGQCHALGWNVRSFDRAQEPKHIKEREGGTLEWGTEAALSQAPGIPDVIYDRGEIGKEPMIRVLGRTPEEVVDKVIQLAEKHR